MPMQLLPLPLLLLPAAPHSHGGGDMCALLCQAEAEGAGGQRLFRRVGGRASTGPEADMCMCMCVRVQ